MVAVLLLCFVALGCGLENPYLLGNTTVCPSRFDVTRRKFIPCNGHGKCVEATGECVCTGVYRGPDCSYALRSRRTAFLLSFLIGTVGAGRLYLGLIGTAVLQLVGMSLLLVLPCFPLCCMCVATERSVLRRLHTAVLVCCGLGMAGILVWWTMDWLTILISGNDAYGLGLQEDVRFESVALEETFSSAARILKTRM